MDKKDEKILTELCGNARLPMTRLAKRTGIGREGALEMEAGRPGLLPLVQEEAAFQGRPLQHLRWL